ncbi:DNA polymerase III subunit beta [Limosilactobacillus mucosae]|uniref:Beta sliding clamp n=1 Tax=Limosilactobacillus mucosae TaxID=97478 RepID=A0AAJ1MBH8_LIMMU|nr:MULTISPECIES: DNA polymerase III subunit beta [Limosilactobacillus]MDD6454772.1 DNA polymerase III subunit beta [Lactobacillus sp.]MDC2829588.1 DNA polymerase III subunit beta [Limosilactobacillus mucosae]MDC2836726.1 DNA polymerase III subunit beta [Limosilactobacillus mucosae]MDC2839386.1 DNA polymerase III subunit beta [Limosilactobacillus mucosae]MDC2845274.1 DNA polymerase III subunit beta [Limosilactobacillus mucosae]
MKFTINRPAFINQLNNVLRAISSKTTIPILTGLKMVVTDHSVILTGSDADITIESTLEAADSNYGLSIEEPGAIVLPARFFNEVIKKLPDKQATIEVFNGLQVRITSGTAEFTINGQDANNYPHLPEVESENTVELASDMLREVIDQTRIAVSKQESRPILTGIHVMLNNGILTAVATDSHRLAQRKVELPETAGLDFDIVLPGVSMTELAKMISDEKDGVKMQITENQALFIFGNTHFYSRLLEGNYPETSRLIPETSDTRLEITASDLLASIERASLLSHESRNNVVKLTVNPENKIATVSGTSADVGNVEEEINADQIVGNPLEISFNPDYMRDALKSFGQTKILISFTTALRPFTLVPTEEKANFVQLITPVRTY